MVVPSAAKRSWAPRRSNNNGIFAAVVVTVIATGGAGLVALMLLRSNSPRTLDARTRLNLNVQVPEKRHAVRGVDVQGVNVLEKDNAVRGGDDRSKPFILYGTAWKKDDTADLVSQAVHAGFRSIDTACQPKHYDESGVGYGWKTAAEQLGLSRGDFFLQTKFSSLAAQDRENIPYDASAELEMQVRASVTASLRNLKTDYIDSVLMHSPMETDEETFRVWKVLEEYVNDGKILQLGISNCYDPGRFQRIYKHVTIKPKVLQNRFHKQSNFDVKLREICDTLGVQYQSFWTLTANNNALSSPKWKQLAREKSLTPQTLMYAFMMTLGHAPLSGTKNEAHMKEDVAVMLRFQEGERVLDENEMVTLHSLLRIDMG